MLPKRGDDCASIKYLILKLSTGRYVITGNHHMKNEYRYVFTKYEIYEVAVTATVTSDWFCKNRSVLPKLSTEPEVTTTSIWPEQTYLSFT